MFTIFLIYAYEIFLLNTILSSRIRLRFTAYSPSITRNYETRVATVNWSYCLCSTLSNAIEGEADKIRGEANSTRCVKTLRQGNPRRRFPKRRTSGGVKFDEAAALPAPRSAARIELNRLTALCSTGGGPSGRHSGRTADPGR